MRMYVATPRVKNREEKMEAGVRIFGGISRWNLSSNSSISGTRCLVRCWSSAHTSKSFQSQTMSRSSLHKSHLFWHGRLISSSANVEKAQPSGGPRMSGTGMDPERQDMSFPSADRPLTNQTWQQFQTSDEKTIVCVHPVKPVEFKDTKPLRSLKPWVRDQRTSLTEDEIKTVQELRNKDGSLWTVNTLARLFNVKRVVIRKVAPANLERQAQLSEEKNLMSKLKPYKRKLLRTQKQMERQKRLETVIAQNKELSNLREKYRSQS